MTIETGMSASKLFSKAASQYRRQQELEVIAQQTSAESQKQRYRPLFDPYRNVQPHVQPDSELDRWEQARRMMGR